MALRGVLEKGLFFSITRRIALPASGGSVTASAFFAQIATFCTKPSDLMSPHGYLIGETNIHPQVQQSGGII